MGFDPKQDALQKKKPIGEYLMRASVYFPK